MKGEEVETPVTTKEVYQSYLKAGRAAAEALQYGKSLVKPGVKYIDVAEAVEEKIRQLGCELAFPCNISRNEVAAHYTPPAGDETIFTENDIIKLDIGTQYNGYIGDNALTVDLTGKYADLVKASREAVEKVTKLAAVGVTLGEVGKEIAETIESYGYKPVRNLSGHGVAQFHQHASPTVPNYNNGDSFEFVDGMSFASEPFATDGLGLIHEKAPCYIYMLENKRPVRSQMSRDVLKEIDKYRGLPFATRWLAKKFPVSKVNYAVRDLVSNGVLYEYGQLVEKAKGMVSQAEHTMVIFEGKLKVTTRLDE
ncbi:type II methionyl aminopeptidase [Candidatus Woesearchaeota archaeon]|nr:type II methionyl aminopeptidase [Candidatus Woesearchaeota archaeon]